MKKISIILAALAACFAVSCTKEAPTTEPQDPSAPAGMKKVTITATAEGATKTTYTDNGEGRGVFSWTKGDQISVWCSDDQFHTLTAEAEGASVRFSGMIPEGVSLGWYAFYPADENHADCAFSIPQYKDLTSTNSTDIPMIGENQEGVFAFKHCVGAAKISFTNVPDFVGTVDVTVKAQKLKISGIFNTYHSSSDATVWQWSAAYGSNDSELTFTRKVKVVDNSATIYLPYEWASNDGLRHESTVSVMGYDNIGNIYQLLEGKTMRALGDFTRAEIKVLTPLELPEYVPPVNWNTIDWNGSNVISPEVLINDDTYGGLTAVKAVADANYLYVKVTAPSTSEWDTLYYDFARGETDSEEGKTGFWGWTTKYEFRNYASGSVTPNSLSVKYNGVSVDTNTTLVGDEICWQMAFPRYAHEVTAESGDIYLGIVAYHGGSVFVGAAPHTWGPMAKITLP